MDKMAGNETGKKKPKLLGFGKVLLRNWMGTNRSHKPTCKVHSKFFVISFIPINPLTPISDQDRISPYSINTISSRQVVRIKKYINLGIIS